MPRAWWVVAGLLVVSISLLVGVYEGFLAVGRLNAPFWLIVLFTVTVPVVIGRSADSVWQRLK